MKIDTRFAVVLSGSIAVGLLAAGYVSFSVASRQARDEVARSASLLLETAQSIRGYTTDEVAPMVADSPTAQDFHPQTVPSYAAQSALRRLSKSSPEFIYREASVNPTSPPDRATDWEAGLIQSFRDHPDLTELRGEVGDGGNTRFYLARPIRIDAPACLDCHGPSDHAPKALLAHYGANGGFGYRLGDVIGIQRVEVPLKPWLDKATGQVALTLGCLACIGALSLATFLLMLRRYFIRPLAAITRYAEATSLGERPGEGAQGGPMGGPFGELREAIDRLKVSVDRASAILERRSTQPLRD